MSRWYYVSFSDDVKGGFLGGAYVRAWTSRHAVARARRLGTNPGGQALVMGPIQPELMDEQVPEHKRERLLDVEEIRGDLPGAGA